MNKILMLLCCIIFSACGQDYAPAAFVNTDLSVMSDLSTSDRSNPDLMMPTDMEHNDQTFDTAQRIEQLDLKLVDFDQSVDLNSPTTDLSSVDQTNKDCSDSDDSDEDKMHCKDKSKHDKDDRRCCKRDCLD